MTALPSPTPIFAEGGARFIPHVIRLKDIPADLRASMSEVWDALLSLNTHNLSILPDQFTDRFLSQYLGRSQRFVQKGLKGLQDAGIIDRHTKYGRRNIEITGRLAKRKEADAQAVPRQAKAAAKTKGKPGPAPRPTTPAELAAAEAANAAIDRPAGEALEHEYTAEEIAQAKAWQARGQELAKRAAEEKARKQGRTTGAPEAGRTIPDAREAAADQKAALDAWMRARGIKPPDPPAKE